MALTHTVYMSAKQSISDGRDELQTAYVGIAKRNEHSTKSTKKSIYRKTTQQTNTKSVLIHVKITHWTESVWILVAN